MARIDCEICRGSGNIRLARHFKAVMEYGQELGPITDGWKQFPCPECTAMVPESNVVLLGCTTKIYDRAAPREVIGQTRAHMARMLIAEVEKRQLVTYERIAPQGREQFRMSARIGIIAPGHIATMADRIAEHQTTLASEVMQEAERQIMIWGSQYTGHDGPVPKDTAARAVREALPAVLKRRAKIAADEGSTT